MLHPHIINHEQIRLEVTRQHLVLTAQRLIMQEVADHVEDRTIQHHETGLERLVRDGLHEVTLAYSRRPQKQHLTELADEAAPRQVVNLFPLDRRVERPVEVMWSST